MIPNDMQSLGRLFTHIDELALAEPSYLREDGMIANDATSFNQKTPVMILDEGSRRIYGTAPDYQLVREVPSFGISCRLMGKTVTSFAKTKRAAKHFAAQAMLHEIVKKDLYREFGIPGQTMEDAHRAVDAIVIPDIRTEASDEDPPLCNVQNENYSGKLLQLCHKNKLDLPQYSYKEDGPPNGRIFTTTCKVSNQMVEGVAKTKKASKNIASQKMIDIIKKGMLEMDLEVELDRDVDEDLSSSLDEPTLCNLPHADDAVKTISEILSDTKRFESPNVEYRILDTKCAFGLTQCLLKISFTKPGEPRPNPPYIFPGSHLTEEGAKQRAAQAAIMFFSS